MAQIPQSNLRACLAVLYSACIRARLLGYEGQVDGLVAHRSTLLADLMDAVHNIPELVLRWPDYDQSLLRGILEDFDQKWSSEGIGLLETYDRAVSSPE
jgi:hypothetical protein